MSAEVLRGDARALPLADASVDLIVTSPPYWSLRSYTDAGEHYAAQIGAEATPAAYVNSLIECTREWMRVLKPGGSIWVNLGDKYATTDHPNNLSGKSGLNSSAERRVERDNANRRMTRPAYGVRQKSLVGLPWRYALRCVDELGLILRAEVIWSKPNGLPESVTDRVRRSHETWFHFTTAPRYYAAVDTIRDAYNAPPKSRGAYIGANPSTNERSNAHNPLGKLPGSVWTIATQPLKVPAELGVDHFAAFPMEWPRRIILGWSPAGICTACGQGRRPVVNVGAMPGATYTVTGETCGCPDTTAPTRPAVVLDPFGGTGTTALVADVLGRHGVSVDASEDYCRLARWRVADPKQRERASRPAGAKPPPRTRAAPADPLVVDQLPLFAV